MTYLRLTCLIGMMLILAVGPISAQAYAPLSDQAAAPEALSGADWASNETQIEAAQYDFIWQAVNGDGLVSAPAEDIDITDNEDEFEVNVVFTGLYLPLVLCSN